MFILTELHHKSMLWKIFSLFCKLRKTIRHTFQLKTNLISHKASFSLNQHNYTNWWTANRIIYLIILFRIFKYSHCSRTQNSWAQLADVSQCHSFVLLKEKMMIQYSLNQDYLQSWTMTRGFYVLPWWTQKIPPMKRKDYLTARKRNTRRWISAKELFSKTASPQSHTKTSPRKGDDTFQIFTQLCWTPPGPTVFYFLLRAFMGRGSCLEYYIMLLHTYMGMLVLARVIGCRAYFRWTAFLQLFSSLWKPSIQLGMEEGRQQQSARMQSSLFLYR